MRFRITRLTRKEGFTILEAMISLIIAVLVLSVVYSVHKTILTVRQGADEREEGPVSVMRLLNEISRDLMCAVPMNADITSLDLLTPDTSTNASELALLTMVADPTESHALEWHTIQRVHYVLRDTGDRTLVLVKETIPKPFTEENIVITNILLQHVAAFRVDVLRDGSWHSTYRASEQDTWPKAARITLQRTEEEAFQTEVFLPAGCIITSSLSRAAAPAP